ncbi:MAG: L-ribulose-5-phosphate 4-epimerase [Planctomycetota bacterium]
MLKKLRKEVCQLNRRVCEEGLVRWTMGNVSGRDFERDLVVIKPSGVEFENLTADSMVVVDLEGNVVEGELAPSVDTPTHLVIYRSRRDVGGIVHTHSNFATAFAAVGRAIPAVLTEIGDEFGEEIPVGKYCQIGEIEIGEEVVRSIGLAKAILMQNHGVFAIGRSAREAVKAAVMVENAAKTVWIAEQLGKVIPIPPEEVARLHRRYVEKYGQGEAVEE